MLRAFDALMAERSVSRAASRLFLSQPAVSSLLKRLREVFADPLFKRSRYGVEPTVRAHVLAPHVQVVLNEVGRLLTVGQDFDPAGSDRIFRLAGSDHMSQIVLPPLCEKLAAAKSEIRLFWEAANYAALAERLQRGDIDMGFLPRTSPPANLVSDRLYQDHWIFATRPGLMKGRVTLDDFCAYPHIFFGYGRAALDDMIEQILARTSHRRLARVAVTSFSQMLEILTRTDNVAVLPARVAAKHPGIIDVHPLPFSLPSYGLYLSWARSADSDPSIHWLRNEIAKIIRSANAPARNKPAARKSAVVKAKVAKQ